MANKKNVKQNKDDKEIKKQITITTEEIKKYFLEVANWKRLARIIYGEAVGGKKRINYNSGKPYRTAPDKDFMKLYLSYTVGLPTQTSEVSIDNKNAASKLAEIIKNDMKERGQTTVSESGQLNTERPTDTTENVDSDKKTE